MNIVISNQFKRVRFNYSAFLRRRGYPTIIGLLVWAFIYAVVALRYFIG